LGVTAAVPIPVECSAAQGVFDQQHPGRSHHLDQRLAEIILGVGVAHRIDHDANGVESGLGRLDGLLDGGLTHREVELHRIDQRAVEIPADGHRCSRVADDQRLRIGLLTLGKGPRRVEAIDVGLRPERYRQRDGVYPNPLGPEQARLTDRVAEVRAPIADQHDMPPAVIREDRSAQLQRRGDVRVMRVGLALELAKLRVLADVHFQLGITAKTEHAGAVVALALLQDAAHGGGFAVQRALHAGGKVGHDQQRLGRRRRLNLESGERGGEQHHDQGAKAERDASTPHG
jgi:hypothetical protein